MTDRKRAIMIGHLIAELKDNGIEGLPEYEQKLAKNAGNDMQFMNHSLEALVALMFSHHGFEVTMRDAPDLRVELDGEVAYAEVTHFLEKDRDRMDDQAMRDSEDLVLVGRPTPNEPSEVWHQLACKAKSKANQYREDAPNILVVWTSSNSVNESILGTAVHQYNACAVGDKQLQRLNAIILIDRWTGPTGSVHLCQTDRAAREMSPKLRRALGSAKDWHIPPSLIRNLYTASLVS